MSNKLTLVRLNDLHHQIVLNDDGTSTTYIDLQAGYPL